MPGPGRRPARARLRAGVCLCLALVVLACAALPAAAGEPIRWLSYRDAQEKGPRAGRPLFLFFRAPWCYFCRKMQRQVFSDPAVAERLNRRFLAVKIDVTRQRRLAEVYQVAYLPTSIFLSPQGKPVLTLRGFLSSQRLLAALAYVAGGHYQRMSFEDYLARP